MVVSIGWFQFLTWKMVVSPKHPIKKKKKWTFPKIVGFPPKSSIKKYGFYHEIFTIHFGGFSTPIFGLETPDWLLQSSKVLQLGDQLIKPTKHHVLVNPWPACSVVSHAQQEFPCEPDVEKRWHLLLPKKTRTTKQKPKFHCPTRWAPTSQKWGYNSYKWCFNPSQPGIMPFRRVITRFKTRRRHSCIFLSLVDFGHSIPLRSKPWSEATFYKRKFHHCLREPI